MAYVTEEDDDDNPYTRDGILKPGRTARVPLMLRDAGLSDVQCAIKADKAARAHAEGQLRKQLAYDAMVREGEQAWRNPDPSPSPATTAAAPPHRDAAPLLPTYDVAEGRRRKQAAYDAMCREGEQAWKKP